MRAGGARGTEVASRITPGRGPDALRRGAILRLRRSDPWCSGPTCQPVTLEIAGSNPVGSATYSNAPDAPFARPSGASPCLPPGTFVRHTRGGAFRHPSIVVIGSIGSRLRLVLRQPGPPGRAAAPDTTGLPEVDFVAYSTSERLSGRIRLDSARLTDMLNTHREFVLVDALAERLPDGGSMVVPEILVGRHELSLVRAGGPRGDRALRIPTAQHRLVLKLGRYLVAGRLHSGIGEDPLAALRARDPMVPLTDAAILFRVGSDIVQEPAGTIVVNRDLVEWVRKGDLDARSLDLPHS